MPHSSADKDWLKDNVIEVSTDKLNPEQDNSRYYRTWLQNKFQRLYLLFSIDLREPQHHYESRHLILRHFERFLSLRTSHPKVAFFLQYIFPLVLLTSIPFSWMGFQALSNGDNHFCI